MRRLTLAILMTLASGALFLTSCQSAPPSAREQANLCDVFDDRKNWYRSAAEAERAWGTPIALQMAIMQAESSFDSDARPPRERMFFGLIPGGGRLGKVPTKRSAGPCEGRDPWTKAATSAPGRKTDPWIPACAGICGNGERCGIEHVQRGDVDAAGATLQAEHPMPARPDRTSRRCDPAPPGHLIVDLPVAAGLDALAQEISQTGEGSRRRPARRSGGRSPSSGTRVRRGGSWAGVCAIRCW
jgi:hypothetical protein